MIRHKKRLSRGDSPTSTVMPTVSMWDDTHVGEDLLIVALHPHDLNPPISTLPTADDRYIEYGAPDVDWYGGWYVRYDFTHIDQLCIELAETVASATTRGEVRAQFSTDEGVSWHYFDGVSGPRLDVNSALGANTVLRGAWTTIAAAAKVEALIRVVTFNSDGIAVLPGAISVWGR